MAGFLIPLAGLALGALGKLIGGRRSARALSSATAAAGASTPSETGLSTAAASGMGTSHGVATSSTAAQDPGQTVSRGSSDPRKSKSVRVGVQATQPATGPVQQNQGPGSPTPAPGDNAGLGARLGRESVKRSVRRNREQQTALSNAALS